MVREIGMGRGNRNRNRNRGGTDTDTGTAKPPFVTPTKVESGEKGEEEGEKKEEGT